MGVFGGRDGRSAGGDPGGHSLLERHDPGLPHFGTGLDMLPIRQTAKQQKRGRGEQAWENELRWTWRKRNI